MIRLLILFLLLGSNSFGEIKTGLYNQVSDTIFIGKAWILHSSTVTFNEDKTFEYIHITSVGCLLWYDIKGTWFTKAKKLYLVNSVLSRNDFNDTVTLVRTTVFKIQGENLQYFNSYFDGEKIGYLPNRDIRGNFMYRKDE